MTGKQAIIDKIISTAELKAQSIINEANAQAKLSLEEAQSQIKSKQAELKAYGEAMQSELIARKQTVAELDAKKYQLFVKQQLLSNVFLQVSKKISEMSKSDYLMVISKLITTYSEDGETVTICSSDKNIITKDFIDSFKKGLVLSNKFGDFDKGIVLSKGSYDKNLTLSVLMSIAREEMEAKVAKLLFE